MTENCLLEHSDAVAEAKYQSAIQQHSVVLKLQTNGKQELTQTTQKAEGEQHLFDSKDFDESRQEERQK